MERARNTDTIVSKLFMDKAPFFKGCIDHCGGLIVRRTRSDVPLSPSAGKGEGWNAVPGNLGTGVMIGSGDE
jgi:hypothetical protein